jgi:hypothetical protein
MNERVHRSGNMFCLRVTDPAYTPEALAAKIEGMIELFGTIGEDGIPRDVRVSKPLGFGDVVHDASYARGFAELPEIRQRNSINGPISNIIGSDLLTTKRAAPLTRAPGVHCDPWACLTFRAEKRGHRCVRDSLKNGGGLVGDDTAENLFQLFKIKSRLPISASLRACGVAKDYHSKM